MQRRLAASLMLLSSLFLADGGVALAQSSASAALINQQLDKQTRLELKDPQPLQEVMSYITKQTGVPIDVQPEVWDLLPWGRETAVKIKIENQTLREALDAMMKKLGLQFVLKDEAIELQPMPALKRLGRKATLSEIEALSMLATTPMGLGTDKTDLKNLLEAVDSKLVALKTPYAVENRTATSGNPVAQNLPVAVPRNATMLEALEALPAQTPVTWYPWGKTIVVWPKQDQVRWQLKREITLRHDGTDVAQVLSELSMRSGVPFRYEPGTFAELAPQARQIKLVLNASVGDALEAVCGLTGLAYQVKEGEVYVWNTQQAAGGGAAGPRDRTIALLTTETGMQILITESTCPPDVREFIEYQKKKHYEALRKMMAEQGFKPSSPASQPASKPAKAPVGANEPPGKDL
jgi:hypothetical protein